MVRTGAGANPAGLTTGAVFATTAAFFAGARFAFLNAFILPAARFFATFNFFFGFRAARLAGFFFFFFAISSPSSAAHHEHRLRPPSSMKGLRLATSLRHYQESTDNTMR
ncbi:MAG TPA: hypothetical protein VGA17_08610 [Nitrospiraceae bacterium]|jgi:hypothetical protein